MMKEESIETSDDDLIIKDVMASIGWSDSFLPIATEDNKKLLNAIKLLGKSKLEHEDALEAQQKEILRIGELHKNADNEFEQNLKLISAHKSQFSTEYHLFKMGEHEDKKFKQMLKEIQKECKELKEYEETCKRKLKRKQKKKERASEKLLMK